MKGLRDVIIAAGMIPPARFIPGKFVRFPGVGKRRGNTAGWCKVISPTLAVYGDWSTGLTAVWRDESHKDDAATRREIERVRAEARRMEAEQRERQQEVARQAEEIIRKAMISPHPYLASKGFPDVFGFVKDRQLLIPIRDVEDYRRVISLQMIDEHGRKKFLPGGRTRGGIFRIGPPPKAGGALLLCEGYATGLSLAEAAGRLAPSCSVIVCFSARNLVHVASHFPKTAVVCADNDESGTGEKAARETGRRWIMPPDVGTDFNDLHQQLGLDAVVEVLRTVW